MPRIVLDDRALAAQATTLSTRQRISIAERIVDAAQDRAPVLTGAYREGMHVEVDGDDVSVGDDDPAAFYKEYGTSDTPPHHSLTDAAEEFGG